MCVVCCRSASDENGDVRLLVGAPSSRRSPAPRYARLGRRPVSSRVDDEENNLKALKRAVPTNFRFAGLGKRKVSLAYKAAGLGKRVGSNSRFVYDAENRLHGGRPEADTVYVKYNDPVFDDNSEWRSEKRRVSTAMRYAGLGKR